MVDIDLLANALRKKGHTVDHVHTLPENAGSYDLTVDGAVLTLAQARALLDPDHTEFPEDPSSNPLLRRPPPPQPHRLT